MAPKTATVQQAVPEAKSKSIYKSYCPCSLVAGRHFASECAPIRRSLAAKPPSSKQDEHKAKQPQQQRTAHEKQRQLLAAQAKFKAENAGKPVLKFSVEEWKELQKVKKLLRQIQDIEDLQRQGKKLDHLQLVKLGRRESLETCLVMVKDRAGCASPIFDCSDKLAETREEASTVAPEDDWQAPVPGVDDAWNATAASEAAEDAKSPAPKKPLFTFTMDEWKELQKVKKLLKSIDAIDALQRDGKKLYQNQLDKQKRRPELENCLVMMKERAGCARPNLC